MLSFKPQLFVGRGQRVLVIRFFYAWFCVLVACAWLGAECPRANHGRHADLMNDLMVVDYWNKIVYDRMPLTFGHFGHAGYFNVPSARMARNGVVGFGYSHVPPYGNFNALVQPLERLEISASYRIFKGIPDPVLSAFGFGDFSDKGANFKVAVLLPEDSHYELPGLALGWEDFLGTRQFESKYIALTQVFLQPGIEVTLGYGWDRLSGPFAGVLWMPWRCSCSPWLRGLSLVAEYDPTDYEDPRREPHPDGRIKKSPVNLGLKYRLWECLDLTLSYVRGDKVAASGFLSANLGHTEGILPKANDPVVYRAPANTEPIGASRSWPLATSELFFALEEQGLFLKEAWLTLDQCHRKIWHLTVHNTKYRSEECVRCRLENLLAALTPDDVYRVVVALAVEGLVSHEYRFFTRHLRAYQQDRLSPYELSLLSPRCEAVGIDKKCARPLFHRNWSSLCWDIGPKWRTFFGSARGKFKYTVGVSGYARGVLFDELEYSIVATKHLFSTLRDCRDVDMLNPSQIINVRSDLCRYLDNNECFLEEGFLQTRFNLGKGWLARAAGGYFEIMYGGVAGEWLFFPANADFAFGLEAAVLWKRKDKGLGFLSKIRKLDEFQPTFQKFQPWQAFLNLYYNCRPLQVDFRISAGQFLAHDRGVMIQANRYFNNGFRLHLWFTYTDGNDFINGDRYHDKGVGFSMPVDFFFTYSCRDYWGYGMSAWLRDVGVRIQTGDSLYETLATERY